MMRPNMGMQTNIPVLKPGEIVRFAPMKKVYTPAGKLIAAQWVRGPERLDSGNIELPDNVKIQQTGVKHLTAILRVIAIGPDVKNCEEDDLVLVGTDVTIFLVNFAGQEMICLHDDGIYGPIDKEHEGDLRSLMQDPI